MNIKTVLIIFGIILILVAGIIFLRFNMQNLAARNGNQVSLAKVTVNKQVFTTEVARTPKTQEEGLSDRKNLAQDHGMLFIFSKPGRYSFWMRRMNFPLDLIYINGTKIVQIFNNVPPPSDKNSTNLPIYQSTQPADKVLEINGGLSQKYGFKKGDTVDISL